MESYIPKPSLLNSTSFTLPRRGSMKSCESIVPNNTKISRCARAWIHDALNAISLKSDIEINTCGGRAEMTVHERRPSPSLRRLHLRVMHPSRASSHLALRLRSTISVRPVLGQGNIGLDALTQQRCWWFSHALKHFLDGRKPNLVRVEKWASFDTGETEAGEAR